MASELHKNQSSDRQHRRPDDRKNSVIARYSICQRLTAKQKNNEDFFYCNYLHRSKETETIIFGLDDFCQLAYSERILAAIRVPLRILD